LYTTIGLRNRSQQNYAYKVKEFSKVADQISTLGRPSPDEAAATGLAAGTASSFTIGDRVSHHMFGDGTVEAVRDHKSRIKFETVGSKEILSTFTTRPR
jgi:hypothetical protein